MKFGRKFQEGGAMPPQGAPAAPQGGEDLTAMLMQAVESQDCQVALQVCQMLLLELTGGGGAPAGGAPQEAAPAPAPAEGEPVYRRGGRLVRRINH